VLFRDLRKKDDDFYLDDEGTERIEESGGREGGRDNEIENS
jgi:hypothetical protein